MKLHPSNRFRSTAAPALCSDSQPHSSRKPLGNLSKIASVLVVGAVAGLSLNTAHAAPQYFTAAGGPQPWDTTTANWGDATSGPYTSLWGSGDAVFEGTGGTVNVSAVNVGQMTINSAGYTLAGGTVTLAGSTITANAPVSVSSALAGTGPVTFAAGNFAYAGPSAVVNSPVARNDGPYVIGHSFALANPVTVTSLGVYAAGLTSGTLAAAAQVGVWNSAGTLLASVTVPAGTPVSADRYAYVSITPVVLPAAAGYTMGAQAGLTFNAFFDNNTANMIAPVGGLGITFTAPVYNAGTTFVRPTTAGGGNAGRWCAANLQISASSPAPVTLSGTNTYTGDTISAASLTIGGAGQLGSGNYAGNITNTGSLTYSSSASQTLSGVISGAGTWTKSGSSMLTLSGANSHTGATTVSAGSIRLGNASALAGSPVTLGVANGLSFAPGIGTFTLGNLAGTGSLALTDTAATAVTLQVGDSSNTSYSGNLSGTGGSLVKQGGGILTMTGGCTMTGPVTVNAGTLSTQTGGGNGTFGSAASVTINNGGTLASGSNGLFGFNANARPVTVNAGGLLTVNGGTGGGPNIFGTLTLAGGTVAENSSVHPTYGSYNFGGASIIATGATTSLLSARDFQFRNAATAVQVDAGSTLNVTGYFSGLGHATAMTLNKTGAGKLILASATAASSHGPTNVNEGTLELSGLLSHGNGKITVAAGATLMGTGKTTGVVEVQAGGFLTMANSTIGVLTLNSSATLAGTTTLEISKDGGTPVADSVFIGTSITYGGTLTVTDITADASELVVGDSFRLFDALSYSGGFTTFDLPALPEGMSWDKSQLATSGTISIINNVSAPAFTPPGGGYAGAQTVTITSDTGSTIYYTMDGTNPGPSSPNGPSPIENIIIPTDSSKTLKAYAVKSGQGDSDLATAVYTTVTTPTWIEPLGGSWSNTGTFNWFSDVVGNGAGVTADFSTLTLDGDASIYLTEARTIGHLRFGDVGDTYEWGMNGSELNLAGIAPSITVNNRRTTIAAPLSGNSGLVKAGAGTLRLTTNEGYNGNTVVNAGTLELAAGGAEYSNSTLKGSITVYNGATCSLAGATALGLGGGVTDIHLNGGTLSGAGCSALGVSYHLTGGSINATGSIRMGVLTGFPDVTLTSAASSTTSVISAGGISLDTIFGQNSLAVTVAQGTTASGIDLQINAPIGGGYSLVKNGAGNLLLAGTNTYTGATTVNAGTLTINGSVIIAAAVNNTATLAGTGNAIGGATIGATAFVAPGGGVTGELKAGATTVNGTYQCQLNGAACDVLTITGNLTFDAASTIAFSTLGGGATAPAYVIASYTGTLTGTPLVTGITGYSLDLNTPNQVRIVKQDGYASWADANVNGQAADLDYDGDGVPNGIEYFMGATVSSFTAGPAVTGRTVSWAKGGTYSGTYGTDYWVETSSTLEAGSWTPVDINDPNLSNGSPLEYTLPNGQPKAFSRLVVTGP